MPRRRAAAAKAQKAGARVILSLAPFLPVAESDLASVSMLIVNEHEAAGLLSHFGLTAVNNAAAAVIALASRLGKTVIATLGPDGAVASTGKTAIAVPAIPVTPVDTTGAGDTFCGVLAALLDEGADLETAMRHAAAAGSLACLKEGAQPSFPLRAEIDAAVKSGRAG